MADTPIVLGSLSPRRQELFRYIFPEFSVVGSTSELELQINSSPREFALQNALFKAGEILDKSSLELPSSSILCTFDTVVDFQGRVLGKPKSIQAARSMLEELSSNSHHVHTGYALQHSNGQILMEGVESTTVWFQPLDDKLLDFYIASGDPMDKAGAYGIQSFGGILVERIEGCFYNVMGLPVSGLYHRLRKETDLLDRRLPA